MGKLTDLQFVKSILPLHYNLREFPDCIRCVSRTGIDDSNGDNEWKTTVMEPLRKHFGNRFQEVYHSTCTNHVDFTIYFKQIDEPAKPKPHSMKQIKTAEEILKEVFSCEPNEDRVGLQFYVTLNPDVDRIIEAMQTYAQQFKPEWTPFNQLPEENKVVLVAAKNKPVEMGYILELEGKTCICTDKGFQLLSDSGFTHWQPLPSLPNPKQ